MFNPLDFQASLVMPQRLVHSAWLEHVPFGMAIVEMTRPKLVVELGVHLGVSYCSFCQAIDQLGLDAQAYGVDTWEGDEHAGFMDPAVLNDLKQHHDPMYGRFSYLIQSKFSDALNRFGDGTIDLLHIDGFHSYEAVKEDFETWRPKMSSRGVVLMHDIRADCRALASGSYGTKSKRAIQPSLSIINMVWASSPLAARFPASCSPCSTPLPSSAGGSAATSRRLANA